eukprot:TRINITY_DN106475_c0_g1_i1.p1 TRINITY_DN106475_c0_g1~~TRINITY_DN106475_c0_g1_i1.p1  ORF type:complete len:261 (+),score=20.44 TRINITY_DN106475_c0_g1_i1:39-785(+)
MARPPSSGTSIAHWCLSLALCTSLVQAQDHLDTLFHRGRRTHEYGHKKFFNTAGWSPVINSPQRDTDDYFALLRQDYHMIQDIQRDYVGYTIDIRVDPCRDLIKAGGLGEACCKDTNQQGCQDYYNIESGQDLQVAFLQNAHVAGCRRTIFETDPNCGTYLEIHRPGRLEVYADIQIDDIGLPIGYRTVFLATHRLCRGDHETWWVVRTRSGPYVQKIKPFSVTAPSCSPPTGGPKPPVQLSSFSRIP